MSTSESQKPGVFVKTFGCQMNEYDSEKMYRLLAGTHRPVATPGEADLVIVNTCSVREKGEHKLFSYLGELRELKAARPLTIGVGGCVAQQEGEAIRAKNRAVDFIVGTHNLSLIPALVRDVAEGRGPQVAVDYRDEWEELGETGYGESPVRALVAIQRGCNKRCSFCVVPTTRGPEVSRSPVEILREVRAKVAMGAREVLLLGQTVNSYGRDLSPRFPFERLIAEVADIPGVLRIRFTSPHPAEVRPEFIELYGSMPKLAHHIHLPLQSGSDRVLKLMNRNYRMRRYFEIVDHVRARVPTIAVSTDLIVGFPTETDDDFELTLEALRRVSYDAAFYFKYSRRPNTVAERDFLDVDEVSAEVADERFRRLHELQEELSLARNRSRIGTTVEVIVEARARAVTSVKGRISQNTPIEIEVDELERADRGALLGSIVRARVSGATPHGLRAVLAEQESDRGHGEAARS